MSSVNVRALEGAVVQTKIVYFGQKIEIALQKFGIIKCVPR